MVSLIYGGTTMNQIKLEDTIHSIVTSFPQAQEVLVSLGFAPMASMATVNTVGRVTTLETARRHLSLDAKDIQDAFHKIDVEVIL